VSVIEKSEILSLVAGSGLPRRRALAQLGLAKSTYYRWLKRQVGGKLPDRKGGSPIPWNKLRPEEEEMILVLARAFLELSSRELALRIVDIEGSYVSESTIFRALKREGLIKPAEIVGFKAGKEYHRKTKRANELWAIDCSHIKVIDWGYYYLVTVMDDYSRFILAWKLQRDMSADSLIEVIQEAIDTTGMTEVSVEDRTKLLSDNGAGYVSRAFRDYLHLVGIRHILAAPSHPQTNGKLERYHQTIKREVNQVPYELPGQLERAITNFVEYYNFRRYHKALGDVTPADVLHGRREQILQRRKEVKTQTIKHRRDYNQNLKELLCHS